MKTTENSRKHKLYKSQLVYWGGIFIIMCLPIISIGNDIGLYFDSVFPDYAATQILDPQEFQVKWFAAFPYLCQIYHGTVGVWISAISIMITGSTSVLQHHMTNIILEFTILFFIDRILKDNCVNNMLRRVIVLLLALSPTVMTIAMTQYYIELPGTICMLGSVLLYNVLGKATQTLKRKLLLFLTFFLCGFAFYSYFNFLFWTIGLFFYAILDKKNQLNLGEKVMISVYGCVGGAVFYFSGFAQIVQNNTSDIVSIDLPIAAWILVWVICLLMLWMLILDKYRIVYSCTGLLALMAVVVIAKFCNSLFASAEALSVGGYYSAGIIERIANVFRCLYSAFTGTSAESLILQEQVTNGWKIVVWIGIIIQISYLAVAFIKKNIINKTSAYIVIGLIYLICCIPFATRMHTQHVIPLVYWMIVVVGMELQYLISFARENMEHAHRIGKLVFSSTIAIICVMILTSGSIFLLNRYKVADRILETGGRGYYTNQINKLADSAIEKEKNGELEIYVFPEWGFMSGFNYLTKNEIAFSTDCSSDAINNFLSRGYTVNIVYWEEANGDKYNTFVSDSGVKKEQEYYYDYDHETVFYNLIFSR